MEPPCPTGNGKDRIATEQDKSLADRIDRARASIRKLERRAYNGGYILSAFLLLSIAATHRFSFLPSLSPALRTSMGTAPPSGLISVALVVYVFSAVILSLSRMMQGSDKIGGITHLGYLGAFLFFYHFSGDMDAHFWAVFAAGATIISLEGYQLWNFCRDEIMKEREVLQGLEGISSRNQASGTTEQ